jgi:hypothetical protein
LPRPAIDEHDRCLHEPKSRTGGPQLEFDLEGVAFAAHPIERQGLQHPVALFASPAVYWTWIVPLATGAGVFALRRRAPWLAGGCLAAAVALAPVFGLIPFAFQGYSSVADQYMYLPLVGLAIAAAGSLRGRIALGVAAVVLLGLGVRSFAQTLLWKDDVTLFTHVVAENPRSYAGHNTVAHAYSLEATTNVRWPTTKMRSRSNPPTRSRSTTWVRRWTGWARTSTRWRTTSWCLRSTRQHATTCPCSP